MTTTTPLKIEIKKPLNKDVKPSVAASPIQTKETPNANKQVVKSANTQQPVYETNITVVQTPVQTNPYETKSIFGEQEDGIVDYSKMSDEEIKAGYDEYIASLNEAGLKTTKLGKNETNFAEYGAALSEEVAMDIINSFDTEADYILQQEIAGLFKNKNVIDVGDFISALKSMGLEVSRTSVKTSYISDAKAHNGVGQYIENGSIGLFTIRDPETGAEIKIPDANGNGAIEVEEVFMNELLSGISKEIDKTNLQKYSGVQILSSKSSALNLTLDEMSEAQKLELEIEEAAKDASEEELKELSKELAKAKEAKIDEVLELKSLSVTDKYKFNDYIEEISQQGKSDKEVIDLAKEWLEDNDYSAKLIDYLLD